MAHYRVYLADKSERFSAAESFAASDHAEAADIAAYVFDACADEFAHAELWCGAERVATSRDRLAHPPRDLDAIIRDRQEQILSLEESLQRSFNSVARSQRLLQRTNALTASIRRTE